MKALLVIDDGKLRKKAFAEVKKLIDKIDQVTRDLESSSGDDQQLFASWFDLTFRSEQQQTRELKVAFDKAAKKLNEITAVASILGNGMVEAYIFLEEERARFEAGSDEVKEAITRERKARANFIRNRVRETYGDDAGLPMDDEDEEFEDDEDFEDQEPSRRPRDEDEEEIIARMHALTRAELEIICRDNDEFLDFMSELLQLVREPKDASLFLKMLELASDQTKRGLDRAIQDAGGPSLQTLTMFMLHVRDGEAQSSESRDEPAEEPSRRPAIPEQAEFEERLKLLYRSLVRRLHPDALEGQAPDPWQKKMWARVQAAYHEGDIEELATLQRYVFLRIGELNDMRLSEISESKSWLREEHRRMSDEVKGLKALPWWGFSKLTNYKNLKKKVAREIEEEFDAMSEEVWELETQLKAIIHMAEKQIRKQTKGKTRPKKTQKKSAVTRKQKR